jgi:hypothetical protein
MEAPRLKGTLGKCEEVLRRPAKRVRWAYSESCAKARGMWLIQGC